MTYSAIYRLLIRKWPHGQRLPIMNVSTPGSRASRSMQTVTKNGLAIYTVVLTCVCCSGHVLVAAIAVVERAEVDGVRVRAALRLAVVRRTRS